MSRHAKSSRHDESSLDVAGSMQTPSTRSFTPDTSYIPLRPDEAVRLGAAYCHAAAAQFAEGASTTTHTSHIPPTAADPTSSGRAYYQAAAGLYPKEEWVHNLPTADTAATSEKSLGQVSGSTQTSRPPKLQHTSQRVRGGKQATALSIIVTATVTKQQRRFDSLNSALSMFEMDAKGKEVSWRQMRNAYHKGTLIQGRYSVQRQYDSVDFDSPAMSK